MRVLHVRDAGRIPVVSRPRGAAKAGEPMQAATLPDLWIGSRKKAGLITAGTARHQRLALRYFMSATPGGVGKVDRRSIRRWLESIGHLSPTSRRNHVSTVRSFLTWCAAEGYVGVKAVGMLPFVRAPRTVPRALSGEQVRILLASISDDRTSTIIAIMVWGALRCCEVAALRMEDVDERAGTLFVVGKGRHERVVPITPELAPYLTRWLDKRNRLPGPLITGRWGGLGAQTVSNLVAGAMRDCGLKTGAFDGKSAHALRHTAASDVLERGAHITTVQAMLGHANVATTSIYLRRARLDDLREAMAGRSYIPAEPSGPEVELARPDPNVRALQLALGDSA